MQQRLPSPPRGGEAKPNAEEARDSEAGRSTAGGRRGGVRVHRPDVLPGVERAEATLPGATRRPSREGRVGRWNRRCNSDCPPPRGGEAKPNAEEAIASEAGRSAAERPAGWGGVLRRDARAGAPQRADAPLPLAVPATPA
ncbi:hypothetical protein GCM10007904_19680 [Oharaeibacter diazotrophicus]|nr:hypothetical protein GCM10007904_19680 [Oharaeibacter diazotrophicus]